MAYIVVAGIAFALGWFLGFSDTKPREQNLQAREQAFQARERTANAWHERQKLELATRHEDSIAKIMLQEREVVLHLEEWRNEYQRLLAETRSLHEALCNGFISGRNWLANAFAEYVQTRDSEFECSLVVKPNPAWKAAQAVAELRIKRAEMARELKFLKFQIASYEEYFPVLLDYRDAILDEVVDLRRDALDALDNVDPALSLGYLTKSEYEKLSTAEKFQMALDRYWNREKSKVEIGRLYERYIGYLYEMDGWDVRYHGALKGFEDFGRDLICTKDGMTLIVQCKCWSKAKTIREKHIMQLFGTCVLFRLTEQCRSASPIFVTTTALSKEAEMVAAELNVVVRPQNLERYPMIKCNINPSTGERIYHLPFDQQYDRVVVGDQPGECYAETIAQAEAAGFRRAFRWTGNNAGVTA